MSTEFPSVGAQHRRETYLQIETGASRNGGIFGWGRWFNGLIEGQNQSWDVYLKSLLLVAAVSVFGEMIRSLTLQNTLIMSYLLAVMIAAFRWGSGPGILTAFLSAAAFDFFFSLPPHSLVINDLAELFTLVTFLVVALVISSLTAKLRNEIDISNHREEQTNALYKLSHDLTTVTGINAILHSVATHIRSLFGYEVAVFFPGEGGLQPHVSTQGFLFGPIDSTAVAWVLHGHGS